jgi:hypothetical protein
MIITPFVPAVDEGYDGDVIRDDPEQRGANPIFPTKSNRRSQRRADKAKYALRSRIEASRSPRTLPST